MLKSTDLWDLEKKTHFRLLFSLETLKIHLGLDSNTGPCASQLNLLSTTPNCLIEFFSKNSSQILRDFCNLSAAVSPVSSTSNRQFLSKRQKKRNAYIFDLDRIFQWNFQNACESAKSKFFIIIFPLWKLVGKKVNYTSTE